MLRSCPRTEEAVKHEGDNNISCSRCPWYGSQRLGKETGGTGDQRRNQVYPDHSTVKIG